MRCQVILFLTRTTHETATCRNLHKSSKQCFKHVQKIPKRNFHTQATPRTKRYHQSRIQLLKNMRNVWPIPNHKRYRINLHLWAKMHIIDFDHICWTQRTSQLFSCPTRRYHAWSGEVGQGGGEVYAANEGSVWKMGDSGIAGPIATE